MRKIYKGFQENMGIYPDHIPQPAQMTHADQISKFHDSLSYPSFELRQSWDHTIRDTKTLP